MLANALHLADYALGFIFRWEFTAPAKSNALRRASEQGNASRSAKGHRILGFSALSLVMRLFFKCIIVGSPLRRATSFGGRRRKLR